MTVIERVKYVARSLIITFGSPLYSELRDILIMKLIKFAMKITTAAFIPHNVKVPARF